MPARLALVPAQDCADDIYFVSFDMMLNGRRCTGFYERDADSMDAATTLSDLLSGQFDHADRVYRANVAHGTWRDVSEDFARNLLAKALDERSPRDLSEHVERFCERHLGCGYFAQALREAV